MVRTQHLWFWLLQIIRDVAGREVSCNVGIVLNCGAILDVL